MSFALPRRGGLRMCVNTAPWRRCWALWRSRSRSPGIGRFPFMVRPHVPSCASVPMLGRHRVRSRCVAPTGARLAALRPRRVSVAGFGARAEASAQSLQASTIRNQGIGSTLHLLSSRKPHQRHGGTRSARIDHAAICDLRGNSRRFESVGVYQVDSMITGRRLQPDRRLPRGSTSRSFASLQHEQRLGKSFDPRLHAVGI